MEKMKGLQPPASESFEHKKSTSSGDLLAIIEQAGNQEDIDWENGIAVDPGFFTEARQKLEERYAGGKEPFMLDDDFFGLMMPPGFSSGRALAGNFRPSSLHQKWLDEKCRGCQMEFENYYLDHLEALNENDPAERKRRIEDLHSRLLSKTLELHPGYEQMSYGGFVDAIKRIADKDVLGVFAALSIVFNQDARVSTLARARAMESIQSIGPVEALVEKFQKGTNFLNLEKPLLKIYGGKGRTYSEYGSILPKKNSERIKTLVESHIPKGSQDLNTNFANILITKYPEEALQTMMSLATGITGERRTKFLVGVLFNLGALNNYQKGRIFGTKATYRSELCGTETAQAKEQLGLGMEADITERLMELPKDQLVQALLLYIKENDILFEQEEHRSREFFERADIGAKSRLDPEGYLEILAIDPQEFATLEDEQARLMVRRHYRKLSMKYHPDRTEEGDEELFKKLGAAHEFLLEKENRDRYGK